MGGCNSKHSIFDDPEYYVDVPRASFREISIENWLIGGDVYSSSFSLGIRRRLYERRTYEFAYQLVIINKHKLRRKIIRRGVEKLSDGRNWKNSCKSKFYNVGCEPSYNQFSFQGVVYTFIDENGLRKLNFEDEDVYGKSMVFLSSEGSLEVPIQTINIGAPLLARHIDKTKEYPELNCLEEFFQVFHGVHVQLEREDMMPLLKFSTEFQVLNVKRYCEQQLIWRDDFKFSEPRKIKTACKYNLNILMNQLLREVKTVEKLAKLKSIAIETKSMDTNISKLLIAKMYQVS